MTQSQLTIAEATSALSVLAEPFHRVLYDAGIWAEKTHWMGVPILKQPLDLWVYQEILAELRPDVIVETGTWQGASALYLAHLCDLLGHGQVLTVDIGVPDPDRRPDHPRITYIQGSSISDGVLEVVRAACAGKTALVILDSDHSRNHVLAEMQAYAPLVTPRSYMIVEDTNLNGHPVRPDWGPGPAEAVEAFLPDHPEFEQDRSREKFGVTFHPGGFLRRLPDPQAWQIPFVPPVSTVVTPVQKHLETYRQARVLFLCDNPDNNQGQWRMVRPCIEAARHGFIADWASVAEIDSMNSWISGGRYNVVVTPRWTFPDEFTHQLWAENRARDQLFWIYEADDDLFTPESVAREVRVFGADPAKMESQRQSRLRMLRDCDGVIVSRPPLAELVSRFTDVPVQVVPNTLDVAWFESRLAGQIRQIPPLTVGWSGASREAVDFEEISKAWSFLAGAYPELRFVVQGNEHAHALLDAVPRERLTILPWTSVDEHPRTLLNIDIACCGVADKPWNLCKSPNKWLEATLAGSACVVSDALYGEYVTHEFDGLVAKNAAQWTVHLSRLVENAEFRERLNTTARQTLAREHALSTQWWHWPQAWSDLLAEAMKKTRSNGSVRQSNAERTTELNTRPPIAAAI